MVEQHPRTTNEQHHGVPAPRFQGALIAITGVGKDGQVGAAIADAFAAEGAEVVMLGREQEALQMREAALRARGRQATAFVCDLTDLDAVTGIGKRVAAGARQTEGRPAGRIDALVNVAGGFAMSGAIGSADLETYRRQVEINLTTAFVASRVFVPLVRDGGSVVYFASATALPGARSAQMSAYTAAKAAVLGLMQSVADEGRARRVRANAVAPTAIRTSDNVRTMGTTARYVDLAAVTGAVLFLTSPAAAAISGQVLRLSD
jgi:NAD(P)-dependent dehydrogenase (short-subunit alcohol dehydrogenase family)